MRATYPFEKGMCYPARRRQFYRPEMKSCPTCKRTYPDDTLAFCLVDGSVLSAPYDPASTKSSALTATTNPPATEVLNPGASLDSTPTPSASKYPQSTIHAPYQPQTPPHEHRSHAAIVPGYSHNQSDYSPRKSSVVKKGLVVLGLLGVLIVTVFLFLLAFGPHAATTQNNRMSSNATNTIPNTNANTSPDTNTSDGWGKKEANLRALLREDPNNAGLHTLLAVNLQKQGRLDEAELFARKAIRIDPNFAEAHYALAAVLHDQGKTAEENAEKKLAAKLAANRK